MRGGRKIVNGGVRLIYTVNGLKRARLGLAVSRKYGNAVQRNRLKRRWRECFRKSGIRRFGVDILLLPTCSQSRMQHPVADLQQSFSLLIQRLERAA